MRRLSSAFLPTLVAVVLAASMPAQKKPASTAKTAAKRPAPAVTAAQEKAATERVRKWLAESAGESMHQPGALAPFFERLLQASNNSGAVHILHFGDSHTAADTWTGALRDSFQQRFGDGGSGFSLAGYPFPGYRRFDARGGATPGWQTVGGRTAAGDGWFGLGGVAIAASRADQSVYLTVDGERIEVDYLQQPGGGTVALYDNERLLERIPTSGETAPGYANFEIGPGPHRVALRTLDSNPVRLFGWVADKPAGVTYEALGINGAEASVMIRWNDSMLATYLKRRDPGLIVLAYGTNEASDPNWHRETYQRMFSAVLAKLRAGAPAASILVVGPGDRWTRHNGAWREVPGIDWVIQAQSTACRESRCAFWDTRRRMGGPNSMRDWVAAGLGQVDRVQFTDLGYRQLAAVLFEDLMARYESYQKARLQ